MNREITIENNYCLKEEKQILCAFDLTKLCMETCTAFEVTGTRNACMCNRGNFEIGWLKD